MAGHEFRSPIAVLLWLARCLRADIYRCVGDFTTVVEYWRPEHLTELKKLMAVVKSTMDLKMSLRVRYRDFALSRARLTAWSDAAMREPKSVGGFVIAIAGPGGDDSLAVLHYSTKTIPLQTTSSTAAEFCGAGNVPEPLALINQVLKELQVLTEDSPSPLVLLDSQPVLQGIIRGYAPYDPLYTSLTKTARMRICQLSQLAQSNTLEFDFCKSADNRADGMTKVFDSEKMRGMWRQLNMATDFN